MGRKTEKCVDCGGRGFYSKPGDRCSTCSGRGYTIIKEESPAEDGSFMMTAVKLLIFIIAAYFIWDNFLKSMF